VGFRSKTSVKQWSSARDVSTQAGKRTRISPKMGGGRDLHPRENINFTTILGGKIVKIEGERAKN